MAKTKYNFQHLNRQVHLYAGLIMLPYIFVFGLSGILFNHPAWLINRTAETFTLSPENDYKQLFPELESIAQAVKDSLRAKGELFEGAMTDIGYENTMILRNFNQEADFRMEIDIPTGSARLLSLPDFAENTTVANGRLILDTPVATDALLNRMEHILKSKNFDPGESRIQRIPNLKFVISDETKKYGVFFSLVNGNYRINALHDRNFKINYFLTNIHQEHGYPVSGFSAKWLWVFFADCLALLMIIWAISGLIMWYQMKRYRTIGIVILTFTILIFLILMIAQFELGF